MNRRSTAMDWGERLLFRSRHIYLLWAGLVNLALGVHYALPEARRAAAVRRSSARCSRWRARCCFSSRSSPSRWRGAGPGLVSNLGLFALFGGVLLYTVASLRPHHQEFRMNADPIWLPCAAHGAA